jgi:hypothetical protein
VPPQPPSASDTPATIAAPLMRIGTTEVSRSVAPRGLICR